MCKFHPKIRNQPESGLSRLTPAKIRPLHDADTPTGIVRPLWQVKPVAVTKTGQNGPVFVRFQVGHGLAWVGREGEFRETNY